MKQRRDWKKKRKKLNQQKHIQSEQLLNSHNKRRLRGNVLSSNTELDMIMLIHLKYFDAAVLFK